MKTEVYRWRVSRDLKSALEREARARNVPVSALLDEAVRDWLEQAAANSDAEEEQRRLHQAAARCIGAFAGSDPRRSEKVRESVRERLRQRHGR